MGRYKLSAMENKPEVKIIPYTDQDPMPFGKHKGKALANVPSDYLIWLSTQSIDWPRLRKYIEDNMEALKLEANKAAKNYRR